MSKYIVEVVTSSVYSSVQAEKGGATRIELCAALATAGVSPSTGMLEMVKKHVTVPVFVMVRPREGDFIYSDMEIEVMKREIDLAKKSGADGFVFGILHKDGTVNVEQTTELVKHCRPLPAVFHRAFDCTPNLSEALEDVIRTGCIRILTSGGKVNSLDGVDQLIQLQKQAGDRISIMPGGGIRPETFSKIFHKEIKEYHLSGRTTISSDMYPTLFEMDYAETDEKAIRTVVSYIESKQ